MDRNSKHENYLHVSKSQLVYFGKVIWLAQWMISFLSHWEQPRLGPGQFSDQHREGSNRKAEHT